MSERLTPEGLPLTVMVTKQCPLCEGQKDYPLYSASGGYHGSIRCPECIGSGLIDVEADNPDLPPRSTAASIKSMEALRLYMANPAKSVRREAMR